MRSPRLVPLALCAAALLAVPRPALSEPTRQEWAEWKQLTETARKAMREGRPGDAVAALKRADGIHKSPSLSVDLAAALTAAGKLVEARQVLTRIVENGDPSILWKRARDAAKKALADLEPRLAKVTVAVRGAPGAAVTIDGAKIATDAEIPLDPGDHTIVASADGYRTVERTQRVGAGQREVISIDLAAAAPAAPAPAEKTSGSRVPGIVLLSVGGAALVAGGVFGGLAFGAVGSAKTMCTGNACSPAASDDIDRSKTFGNVSTGLFIGGGVVAAVGIVLTIVAPGGKKADEPPKDRVSLAPYLGAGAVGLTGRF